MTARLRLLLILAALLLALAVGVFAVSQSRPVRQRALVWAQAVLAEAVGREVRVEDVTLRPWAGSLVLSRIQVARERSLADGILFSAETIRARWSWTALLRRQLVLRQITLVRPRLTLAAATAPSPPATNARRLHASLIWISSTPVAAEPRGSCLRALRSCQENPGGGRFG